MVNEQSIPPYLEWLPGAISSYAVIVAVLALTGLFLAFFISAVRYGPLPAGDMIYRLIVSAAVDLIRFSPKRVYALARLAVQESVRRRVWVALVVFGLILMFAGWFLDPAGAAPATFLPAKLYIDFVLTATSYLVMLLALFLSAFSLPTDIKNRTIYTVVTKPVRTGEIVLGRMLGFTAIGTALLILMGIASYVFVTRTLDHTHELTAADLTDVASEPGSPSGNKEGKTSVSHGHFHHVTLDAHGNGITDVAQGHFHRVHADFKDATYTLAKDCEVKNQSGPAGDINETKGTLEDLVAGAHVKLEKNRVNDGEDAITRIVILPSTDKADNKSEPEVGVAKILKADSARREITVKEVTLTVGPPEDELVARVPIYAHDIAFVDRSGKEVPIGINIGKEWTYRSFLDGGTPMSATWTFTGITKEKFPDGRLPLEMYLRVFRTYKGEIADEKKNNRSVGIAGSLMLRNPQQPSMKTVGMIFQAKDQMIDRRLLPAAMERQVNGEFKSIGLFKQPAGKDGVKSDDCLVSDDGRLEVVLQCLSPSQYLGVAKDDVYLKTADNWFVWNFCKGYAGIWLQMVLVIGFGVMFSTFLSGPVAMLATGFAIVMGFFTDTISSLFTAVLTHNFKLVPGGGPIESIIGVVRQSPITIELEPSTTTDVIHFLDKVIMLMEKAVVSILPNFPYFSNVQAVADGFDVSWDRLMAQATTGFGFLLALFLAGHIFLRMRELAK